MQTKMCIRDSDEIAAAAEDIGFNIRGAEIIDPENYDGMDEIDLYKRQPWSCLRLSAPRSVRQTIF